MSSMSREWSREETIVAFNVYCKIPFEASSKTHPLIVEFAELLGRSPSALNMKVGNFGRLDPLLQARGIVGLRHGARLEEEVWHEFHGDWERLAYESERLVREFRLRRLGLNRDIEVLPRGEDCSREVKQRVNQDFFRAAVLSAYNFQCCITGITQPELLVASHIIPWAKDATLRTNPRNGLCLNALHDRAFDRGLLTVTGEGVVRLSECLLADSSPAAQLYFHPYEGETIREAGKFTAFPEFLDYHQREIFLG